MNRPPAKTTDSPRVWRVKLARIALLCCIVLTIASCRTSPNPAHRDAFDPVIFAQTNISQLTLINAGSRQWRVRADVDGQTGMFAIDTGSANTVLSQQFADKLTTSPVGKFTVRSTSKNSVGYINVNYLSLGSFSYLDFYAPVADLDHVNAALPSPIDGILGMNILGKTRCTIDWKNHQLTLEDKSSAPPTNTFPLTIRDHRLCLSARLNNRPVELTLDTGAYRSCLAKKELSRLSIPASKRTHLNEPRIDIIESRDVQQTQVELDNFQLGPINRPNYQMLVWDHNVLGMDLLETFVLTFDARGHWLTLTSP